MSMNDYPCSGYLVQVRNLREFLPVIHHGRFDELLEEVAEEEDIEEFLRKHLPSNFPTFESIYIPKSEDIVGDNMENGEIYMIFDKSTLWISTPTDAQTYLCDNNVRPEYGQWCVYG